MCGIAGLVHWEPRGDGARQLGRARELLAHRGPDDWGVLSDGPAGLRIARELPDDHEAHWIQLLHLRLSIIDLTTAGWQPMCSSDGRHAIVLNGEIYNHQELRCELERSGRSFHSRSDTEVLLVALQEWGIEALGRLTGMFAFAWVDLVTRDVVLARDPFGIKPLYLAEIAGGVAFASEPSALLAMTDGPRRVDAIRLGAFLRYGVSDFGAGTLFAGVRQVPPGHWMRIRAERREVGPAVPYWKARRQPRRAISLAEAASEVRELFEENIRLHLQSDVPVGASLSGGIDSGAIVAMMRRLAGTGREIHAFSFLADDAALSEERWIRLASDAAGLTLHLVRPEPQDAVADLSALIRLQGEPVISPSIYAQYRVFRLAAERGIKVVLSGQGADEVLAGYAPYAGARLAGLLRRGQVVRAAKFALRASQVPGQGGWTLPMQAVDFLAPPRLQRPLRRMTGRELIPGWMDAQWFEERGAAPAGIKYSPDETLFWAELERTLTETTLPYLLRYDDRNSMALGIESRFPFLTTAFLELCWSLPEEYLLDDDGVSKRVFRDAMRGSVPDAILGRRDKLGMATPIGRWLAAGSDAIAGLLDFAADVRAPGIRVAAARRAVATAGDDLRIGGQLWRCIGYLEWLRQFGIQGAA